MNSRGALIIPIILSKLDFNIVKEWVAKLYKNNNQSKLPTLQQLIEFLNIKPNILEAIKYDSQKNQPNPNVFQLKWSLRKLLFTKILKVNGNCCHLDEPGRRNSRIQKCANVTETHSHLNNDELKNYLKYIFTFQTI